MFPYLLVFILGMVVGVWMGRGQERRAWEDTIVFLARDGSGSNGITR